MVNNRGFTLIESIIAIAILTSGIIVIYGVFYNISDQVSSTSYNLIASYLAQEGIEVIRNIRDNNWIQNPNSNWLNENCEYGCNFEVDYSTNYNNQINPYGDNFLNIDSNNMYSYSTLGDYSPTIFKRKISIGGSNDVFTVTSLVTWEYKGDNFFTQINEILYNWY